MLINNLSNHRSKYSLQKNKSATTHRPSSLTVLPRNNSKTEKRISTARYSSTHIQIKPVTLGYPNSQPIIKSNKNLASSRLIKNENLSFLNQWRNKENQKIPSKKMHAFFKENKQIIDKDKQNQVAVHPSQGLFFEDFSADYSGSRSKCFKRKIVEKKLKNNRCLIKSNKLNEFNNTEQSSLMTESNRTSQHRPIFKATNKTSISTQSSNFLKSRENNQIQQQLIYIDTTDIVDQNVFLQNLKPNQVFFCKKCFRYVFVVQKYYHYPKCQHQLDYKILEPHQKYQIGASKLEMLEQLSKYTKQKYGKIKILLKLTTQNSTKIYCQNVRFMDGIAQQVHDFRNYYSVSEIDLALDFIYKQLMKEESQRIFRQAKKSVFKIGQKYLCKAVNLDCQNQLNI